MPLVAVVCSLNSMSLEAAASSVEFDAVGGSCVFRGARCRSRRLHLQRSSTTLEAAACAVEFVAARGSWLFIQGRSSQLRVPFAAVATALHNDLTHLGSLPGRGDCHHWMSKPVKQCTRRTSWLTVVFLPLRLPSLAPSWSCSKLSRILGKHTGELLPQCGGGRQLCIYAASTCPGGAIYFQCDWADAPRLKPSAFHTYAPTLLGDEGFHQGWPQFSTDGASTRPLPTKALVDKQLLGRDCMSFPTDKAAELIQGLTMSLSGLTLGSS